MKKIREILIFFVLVTALPVPVHSSSVDSKDLVINKALDDWEAVDKRHEEMAQEYSWPEVDLKHRQMAKEEKKAVRDDFSDMVPREKSHGPQKGASGKHQYQVGTEFFYAKYKEPDVMEQRGTLWGVNGSYTYRPAQGDVLNNSLVNTYVLEGMMAWGNFKYEAEAPAQTGLQVDKDDYMFELRGLLGQEYFMEDTTFMPYSGFAYRYLNDDDDGSLHIVKGSSFYGYEREANYYYVPAGVVISRAWQDGSSVHLRGEYDFFIWGLQKSHVGDGNAYLPTPNQDVIEHDQHKGFGIRGSIEMVQNLGRVAVFAEPFFRYWHIENSDVVTAFVDGGNTDTVEPENKTIEAGVKFGVKF